MTVTILHPKSAHIVVDLQKGIAPLPTVHPVDAVIKHVGALTEAFRGHGLPVVLAGVATRNGVEVTARQAYELCFNVTLATNAMTDLHAGAHTHSVTQVFPRIGETGTAEEVIELLERSA